MPAPKVKRLARQVCPPVLWEAGRRCYRYFLPHPPPPNAAPPPPPPPPPPLRLFSTGAEIDEMIDACIRAADGRLDRLSAALAGYHFVIPTDMPADPGSAEYRAAQLELYRRISGRNDYLPEVCEQTPFDMDLALRHPFPYSAHCSAAVGEQLMGVGRLIHALGLSRPARVLEFGPGYGKLTTELVQLGHRVTAVDVCPAFLELGARRCRMLGLEAEAVCAGMLDYRPEGRFDRVIFNESFHHCFDHEAMVARLDDLVAPDGAVLFASEPIVDWFYFPWGVRLDGESIFAIRRLGWMELGFTTEYFLALLARHGWAAARLPCHDVPRHGVFVARRR